MATTPTRKKVTVAAGQTSPITFAAAGGTFQGWEITGNAKPITITATTGSNIMTPGNAVQNLVTGASNDTLKGNGKSSLQGGAGNDAYIITKAGDTIIEAVGAGNDTVQSSITGTAGYSLAANVENLTLTGSALAGQGNTLDNVITGNSGKNTLTGGGGADTINAGSGNDLIIAGSAGLNLMNINGGSGIDTLQIDAASGQLYAVNLDNISNVEYFKVGSNVYSPDRFAGIVENQQTLSTSNANLSTANASAAVALSTANASNTAALSTANASATAALSTSNASATAALSTSNASATEALSTANASNALALSTANASNALALSTTNGQLSTANSTISVLSTSTASNAAEELQNAVNNLALIAQVDGGATPNISIVGGLAANTYYAVAGGVGLASYVSTGPSPTLNGNNNLNLPSALTGTAAGNWYMIGGIGNDTFIGNSSANTFIGGSGADIITSGGGADSIVGGDGNDLFNFANGDLTSSVTLSGGNGTNTINFTAAATVADADFANVSNLTTITGTNGALNISVGSSAQAAGVSTITGGTSADSFSDVLTTGSNGFTFIGGSGADTFTFATAARLGVDYVQAGTASDTIVLSSDGQSLVDSTFARITGTIESLSLANGNNSIVFGTTAYAAGFTSSVTTGSGDDYISIGSGYTTTSTFNSGAGNDTFVLGSTSGVSLNGGLGDDTFSAAGLTGANVFTSYINGSAGTNVLAFGTGGALIEDSGFTNASNIQSITSVGALSADLSLFAEQAGIVSVSGSTGADTIAYVGTTAITFTGGSGADNFTVSGVTSASTFSGGDANDTFTFETIGQLALASVDGGAGSNSVVFSGGVSATDANFNRIAAGTVQALTVTGSASSIIVGSNAIAAGITTISGGTANDTIIANYGTTAVTLSGGGGADTFGGGVAAGTNSSNVTYSFAGMTNYTGSTIFANAAGTNVLAFAEGVTFEDANFTNSSSIQTLALNGTAGSNLTVDANGATTGITAITASGATTGSIITLGNFTNAISFVGSAGNDTFVVGSGAGFTSASSINAGAGTADVISYGIAGGTVTDTIFQKITAGTAEVLSATSSTNITVGSNALNAGIRTFSAGTGAVEFTVSSGFGTNGMNLTGSTNDDTFTFVDGSALGNSTVNGGVGADSIVFTNAVTITSIANVSNVETIYLNGTAASTLTIGNQGTNTSVITINGTSAANTISASLRDAAGVSLVGGNFSDTFVGSQANDTLQGWSVEGSTANDTLTGGSGFDKFVITSGSTTGGDFASAYAGGYFALITDYGVGDSIALAVSSDSSSMLTTGPGSGYDFQIQLASNGQVIAKGNYASTAASTQGILFTSL